MLSLVRGQFFNIFFNICRVNETCILKFVFVDDKLAMSSSVPMQGVIFQLSDFLYKGELICKSDETCILKFSFIDDKVGYDVGCSDAACDITGLVAGADPAEHFLHPHQQSLLLLHTNHQRQPAHPAAARHHHHLLGRRHAGRPRLRPRSRTVSTGKAEKSCLFPVAWP